MQPLATSTPRAQKQHYCDLCSLPIERGTVHHAVAMADSGYAYTFRAHFGCGAICSTHPEGKDRDWDDCLTSTTYEIVIDEMDPGALSPEDVWPESVLTAFDGLDHVEQARVVSALIAHQNHTLGRYEMAQRWVERSTSTLTRTS